MPDVVDAGRAVAEQGWLDARTLGRAARSSTCGAQTLKRLWHWTARSGGPAPAG